MLFATNDVMVNHLNKEDRRAEKVESDDDDFEPEVGSSNAHLSAASLSDVSALIPKSAMLTADERCDGEMSSDDSEPEIGIHEERCPRLRYDRVPDLPPGEVITAGLDDEEQPPPRDFEMTESNRRSLTGSDDLGGWGKLTIKDGKMAWFRYFKEWQVCLPFEFSL